MTARLEVPDAGVRVAADIGGTHARFATVADAPQQLGDVACLRCADYQTIGDAFRTWLGTLGNRRVERICVSVAGPVVGDRVDLPNSPWTLSRTGLEAELGVELTVINDFMAQALSVDALGVDDVTWIGAPRPSDRPGVQAILGPGTGLGVALRTAHGDILPSEGGHVSFAPSTPHEIALLRCLVPRYGRVSSERLLSGPGLENLFRANRELDGCPAPGDGDEPCAATIAARAEAGDPLARRAVTDFFDILASYAGDVALFAESTGGVFLSGGVLRKLSAFLDPDRFRQRFEDKGRMAPLCRTMPVGWISHPYPGLLGCAALLARPVAGQAGGAPPAPGAGRTMASGGRA
ncbi:MAG TPA: glucokinase [Longimicrobiales bacterium]|nr:glucokinase [Longimicrobiales bacterium]